MMPLEELLQTEREAAEPSPDVVRRTRHRVMSRAGIAGATTVAAVLTTKVGSASLFAGSKALLTWTLVGVVTVGIGAGTMMGPFLLSDPSPPSTQQPLSGTKPTAENLAHEARPPAESPAQVPDQRLSAPEGKSTPKGPRGHSRRAASTHLSGRPVDPKAPAALAPLDADLSLLRRVNAALNQRQGAHALSLLNAEQRKGSAFAVEFLAARAIALCQTGNKGAAQRYVQSLRKNHSESPVYRRVETACGLPASAASTKQ